MGDHLVEDRTLASRWRRLLAPGVGADLADLPDPSPLPPGQPEPPPLRGIGAHRRRVAAVDRHPAAAVPRPDAGGEGRRPKGRIDPRIRQRRIQVKREEGRRRLRALVATTTVLVLVAAGFGALRSPLLRVHHIVVTGADRTPVAAVDAAGGLSHHRLMIDVNGAGAAAAIDRLPWVASARVHRSWPTTVVVMVRERVAVAQVGPGGTTELVDGSGRVLGPAPVGAVLPAIELGTAAGATTAGASPAATPAPAVGAPLSLIHI